MFLFIFLFVIGISIAVYSFYSLSKEKNDKSARKVYPVFGSIGVLLAILGCIGIF